MNSIAHQGLVRNASFELPVHDEPRSWVTLRRLLLCFLALGIGLRLLKFLVPFPLWGDEALLTSNLIQRGYLDLMRPLGLTQVAPLSYLWIERAAIQLFGVSEYSLRAFSLVAGIGGLVLFRYVAGRVVQGWALVFAVAVLAVSHFPIRHSAEVKPYASDLLAAALLLYPALSWWNDSQRARLLWFLAPCVVVAQALSFTAVFVAGGISLALVSEVWRRRDREIVTAFIAYNVALLAAFGLFIGISSATGNGVGESMQFFWAEGFPPSWTQPWQFFVWLVRTHTGEALAYPLGGQDGGSIVQAVLCTIGGVSLWRRNDETKVGRLFVGIALGTMALGFIAAVLHRYPYAAGERLQQYWAPFVCVLFGQGIAVSIAAIRSEKHRMRNATGVLVALAVLGVGQGVFSIVHPFKFREDYLHRSFAEWFWSEANAGGPLVAIEDLGVDLAGDNHTFTFDCLRAIYDKRFDYTSIGESAVENRLDAIRPGTPLRMVAFGSYTVPLAQKALEVWKESMTRHYRFTDETQYPVTVGVYSSDRHTYYVWNFEPLTPDAHPRLIRETILAGAQAPNREKVVVAKKAKSPLDAAEIDFR
ncbi:MAG: glycosyltransferase family 39 protein [Planctomycetia bacterium]|nr:glycosyltransferase family 39 protein [Planctomycetia bacterium]